MISQVSIALDSASPSASLAKAGDDQHNFTHPSHMPEAFRQFIFENFLQDYDMLFKVCADHEDQNGQQMPVSKSGNKCR